MLISKAWVTLLSENVEPIVLQIAQQLIKRKKNGKTVDRTVERKIKTVDDKAKAKEAR